MATNTPADNVIYNPNQFQVDQEAIARRKAIADAMMQSSLEPQQGQMVSGHYVGPNWATSLGKLGQALVAARMRRGISEDQSNLIGRYQQGEQQALQDYMARYQQSPQAAVQAGYASPYPQIQALAKAQGEKLLSQKDILDNPQATLQSKQAALGGGGVDALQAAPKTEVINGQLVNVDPNTGKPMSASDFRDKYGPIQQGPAGTVFAASDTGKPEFAHSVNVTALPANVAGAEAVKHGFDRLDKSYESAQGGQSALLALQQAQRALRAGIFNGPGADMAAEGNRILDALGFQGDRSKLKSNADYQNAMVMQAAQLAKANAGARVTNYEEQVFQKAAGGASGLTQAEKQALVDIATAKAANNIQQHQNLLKNVSTDPVIKPYLPSYAIPSPTLPGDRFSQDPQTGLYSVNDPNPEDTGGGAAPAGSPTIIRYDAQGNRVQ